MTPPGTTPVRSNARRLLLGNVAYAFGQWAQLVIVARSAGAAAVGAYSYALALTSPVMMLASLQLRALLATDAEGAYRFRDYWHLRVATTVAALLVLAGIAWSTGEARTAWAVLVPVSLMRALDTLSDIFHGLWQRHERMGVVAWGLALNAGTSTVFMFAAVALVGGVAAAASGAALGSAVALAFVWVRAATDPDTRASMAQAASSSRRVARLAAEGLPMGVIVLLGALQQNVPRYFIRFDGGEAALGVFTAASQLTGVGMMVIAALGGAASPRLAALRASGELDRFRALTRKLLLVGAALGVGGVALSALLGRSVLVLVFGAEFGAGDHVLLVLSAAAGVAFVAQVLGYALTSARLIGIQPFVLAATLAVLATSCALLVPRMGALGAAWAVVAGSVVQAATSALALRQVREPGARARGGLVA